MWGSRRLAVVLLMILGLTIAAPMATAQDAVEPADLAIEQPGYVDGGVSEVQRGNHSVYEARGERLLIRPQNFDGSQVLDYGVTTDVGSLRYDDELGLFVFTPEGEQGTFDVYWVVNKPVTTTVTRNNSTQNVTEMRQIRYQARIKVTGQAQLSHLDPGQLDTYQADAERWRDWNATLQDVRAMDLLLVPDDVGTETLLQSMVNNFVTVKDPIQALFGGSFTTVGFLYVSSIGGATWLIIWLLVAIRAGRQPRKRLNIFESTEAAEGELAEKMAAIDEEERKRALQNLDWEDIFEDEHAAAAFREAFGETVFDGYKRLSSILQPELIVRDRLQAMSESGYIGVVEREDGEIVDARVLTEGEAEDIEGDRRIDLSSPGDAFLKALDWEDETIMRFDLVESDYDPGELETVPETLDLAEILDQVDVQEQQFDDPSTISSYLYEFVASVREHEFTASEGKPRTMREILNTWLQLSQTLRDRYHIPAARLQAEHLERAIIDYDPGEQAERLVREIEEGRNE